MSGGSGDAELCRERLWLQHGAPTRGEERRGEGRGSVPEHTAPGFGLPEELLSLNPAGEEPGQPGSRGLLPAPGCHADFYGQ